jgi:hypothetical protein
VGGGVQLGPISTAATNRPKVPTSVDYADGEFGGMMIGKGNRSTRRKPVPLPFCPPQTPTCYLDANPCRRGGKPATNRLSCDTTFIVRNVDYSVELELTFRRNILPRFSGLKFKQSKKPAWRSKRRSLYIYICTRVGQRLALAPRPLMIYCPSPFN